MYLKKIFTVILSVVVVFTAICGCFAVTANAETTVTYSYVIDSSYSVNAFEGKVFYPFDSLRVKSITFNLNGQSNDNNDGIIRFNTSNISNTYDLSEETNIITVEFEVLGSYDSNDVYGEINEFYNIQNVLSGNSPFNYSNVINGEVISYGYVDIDNPSNSYSNINYSVIYTYEEAPGVTSTCTKKVRSSSSDPALIAELGVPYIQNPYFNNYSVKSASLSGSTVYAVLNQSDKKYTVYLNGVITGRYNYLQKATVNVGYTCDFLINGVRVARGDSYSFYVTADTDITTESPSGEVGESATIIQNALYLSNSENGVTVKMELLASATSSDFSRMGIAFAAYPKTQTDLKDAINIVSEGSAVSNKISVYNSAVDMPNISGQYQFIYAPYASVTNVNKNMSLYFYSYVVDNSGNITISDSASQINFSNVIA